jgi:hypothetical protein
MMDTIFLYAPVARAVVMILASLTGIGLIVAIPIFVFYNKSKIVRYGNGVGALLLVIPVGIVFAIRTGTIENTLSDFGGLLWLMGGTGLTVTVLCTGYAAALPFFASRNEPTMRKPPSATISANECSVLRELVQDGKSINDAAYEMNIDYEVAKVHIERKCAHD